MAKKTKRQDVAKECICRPTNAQIRNYLSKPVTWISALVIVIIDVIAQVIHYYSTRGL